MLVFETRTGSARVAASWIPLTRYCRPDIARLSLVPAGTLGGAICKAFADAGARIHAVDLSGEAVAALVTQLVGDGHSAAQGDASTPAAAEAIAGAAFAAGPVDSLVYAAGITHTRDVVDTDWPEYRRLMAVNLDGVFHVLAAVGRRLSGRRPTRESDRFVVHGR